MIIDDTTKYFWIQDNDSSGSALWQVWCDYLDYTSTSVTPKSNGLIIADLSLHAVIGPAATGHTYQVLYFSAINFSGASRKLLCAMHQASGIDIGMSQLTTPSGSSVQWSAQTGFVLS